MMVDRANKYAKSDFEQKIDAVKQAKESGETNENLSDEISDIQNAYAQLSDLAKKEAADYDNLKFIQAEYAIQLVKEGSEKKEIEEDKGMLDNLSNTVNSFVEKTMAESGMSDTEYQQQVAANEEKFSFLASIPVVGPLIGSGAVAFNHKIENSARGKKAKNFLPMLGIDGKDKKLSDVILTKVQESIKKFFNIFTKPFGIDLLAVAGAVTGAAAENGPRSVTLDGTKLSGKQTQTVTAGRIAGKPNNVEGRSGVLDHNDKQATKSRKIYSPVNGKVVGVKSSYAENRAGRKLDPADFGNYVVIKTDDNGPFKGKTYQLGHIDGAMRLKAGDPVEIGDELASIEFGSGSGTGLHYSDGIGDPGATVMKGSSMKNHIDDSKKLADITIDGPSKTVEFGSAVQPQQSEEVAATDAPKNNENTRTPEESDNVEGGDQATTGPAA